MARELELTKGKKTLKFLGKQANLNNHETGKPSKTLEGGWLASTNKRQEHLGNTGKADRLVKKEAGKV